MEDKRGPMEWEEMDLTCVCDTQMTIPEINAMMQGSFVPYWLEDGQALCNCLVARFRDARTPRSGQGGSASKTRNVDGQ